MGWNLFPLFFFLGPILWNDQISAFRNVLYAKTCSRSLIGDITLITAGGVLQKRGGVTKFHYPFLEGVTKLWVPIIGGGHKIKFSRISVPVRWGGDHRILGANFAPNMSLSSKFVTRVLITYIELVKRKWIFPGHLGRKRASLFTSGCLKLKLLALLKRIFLYNMRYLVD